MLDLSGVGRGVADLLVLYRGVLHLVECKNPETGYGRAGLSKSQRAFKSKGWPMEIAYSATEAEQLVQKWSEAA